MVLDDIRDYISYNRYSGQFTWLKLPKHYYKSAVGCRAGSEHHTGYRYIKFKGKSYAEHRLAWFFEFGELPTFDLDHKDRIRSNNSILNLRPCCDKLNSWNAGPKGNTTSLFKGVCWKERDRKWVAQILVGKVKEVYRGDSELEAAMVYNIHAEKSFGVFALLNKVFEEVIEVGKT